MSSIAPASARSRPRPLEGKRVLVTRPAEQSRIMLELLEHHGAEALVAPVIEIRPLADQSAIDAAVEALGTYQWIAFTSANGVDRFLEAMRARDKDPSALGAARIAAIGPGTAAALAKSAVDVDWVAPEHDGEGFAASLLEVARAQAGERLLLPRALVARDVVPDTLRGAGLHVDVLPIYETVSARAESFVPVVEALSSGRVDAVTLTSASTAVNLVALLGPDAIRLLSPVIVASIGPITTQAAVALGVRVDVTACPHTVTDLVLALEEHFEKLRQAPT